MNIESLANPELLAHRAAQFLIDVANRCIDEKDLFFLAISGGSTPRRMLEILSESDDIPWEQVHVFQVDERIAPVGDPDRNATMVGQSLFTQTFRRRFRLAGFWNMPVETDSLEMAAVDYATQMGHIVGVPVELDLIQLGLGDDGHTASLVPGDPVLEIQDRDVAVTETYQGRRRMTFTTPLLLRAKEQMWLVSGEQKQAAAEKLLAGDPSIPASSAICPNATLLIDAPANPNP